MHSSTINKCLMDKNVTSVLCHLFHRSHQLENINSAMKRRSPPLLTMKNNFTLIFNSILEKQILFDSGVQTQRHLDEYAVGFLNATKTISNILNVSQADAKAIVKENKQFDYTMKKTMIDNYNALKIAGMSIEILRGNISILAEDSDVLKKKLASVQTFVDDIDFGVPLLFNDLRTLDRFISSNTRMTYNNEIRSKVYSYGQLWKVQNKDLYSLISKYMNSMIFNPNNTVELISLLLEHNVNVKNLLTKNWDMHVSSNLARDRLEKISHFGCLLQPWILTSNSEEFHRKLKFIKNKNVKIQPELFEYLSLMSGYNTALINNRFSLLKCNYPYSNLNHAQSVCKTIITKGYEWHDIIWSLNVLALDKQLVNDRFDRLESFNFRPPFLNFLLLSERDFVEYVNKHSQETK